MGAAAAGKGLVDFGLVYRCAWAMLACCLGSSAVTFAVNFGMMRIGRLTAQKLRSDVFHKLLDLPVSFFDRNQAGDIISRVSYDVDVVGTCISADLSQILTSLVTVTGSFVMMAVISPVLTAVTLVTIPMAIGYTRRMNRVTKPLFSRRSAAYGGMNGFAEEKFSGLATIQSYAREEQTARRFAAINDDAADAYYQATRTAKRMGPNVRFINDLGLALIAILGSLLYMRGYIGLDQISAFVLYSRKFSGPINEIANITNEIYSGLAAAERVFQLLDAQEEAADVENARELTSYLSRVIAEQLERSVQAGQQYREDSDYIGQAMEQFNDRVDRLKQAIDQIAVSISSISSSIDGAASGISGAASSTRVLVEDMDGITGRMDANQEIVGELQKQMDMFANL